jgi:hypothetical protein
MNETLSCVTDKRLVPYQDSDNLYKIFFRAPVRITARNGNRFYLQITQVCTAEERDDGLFKAHTREYSYVFSDSSESSHHGIVSYHWHPNDFALRDPHLHLKITPQLGYPEIERKVSRAHFPTSRVCLEDFIGLLINHYDIVPAIHHSTCRSILRKNKAAFGKEATWFIVPK